MIKWVQTKGALLDAISTVARDKQNVEVNGQQTRGSCGVMKATDFFFPDCNYRTPLGRVWS